MNKLSTIIFLLLYSFLAKAQLFTVDTLLFNGNSNDRINLVILADGYQSNELNQFIIDANSFKNDFFGQSPYSNYANYFNVFTISVPSVESGASHPGTATDVTEPAHPISSVNNYFGSTFDYFDIHRLLVATNNTAINTVLANNFPNYDQVLVLVNTPYYGGSGGSVATTSLDAAANEIAIHEIGHSFVGLIDEYYAGDIYAREGINMTAESDPTLAKWSNWSGSNGISTYQHCCGGNSSNWYRPHQNCKMRYLNSPFCAVCKEGTIEKIHDLISPIEGFQPTNTTLIPTAYPFPFKLDLIKPIPNTLKTEWTINNSVFQSNTDSIEVFAASLNIGSNAVEVSIEDTSAFLRVNNHFHYYTVSWTINNSIVGIENIKSQIREFDIHFYPNPSQDILNIDWLVEADSKRSIRIRDLNGKVLIEKSLYTNSSNSINIENLSTGVYSLEFLQNNNSIGSRKLIKN